MSGDFLPKPLPLLRRGEYPVRNILCVSFECDPLSEKLEREEEFESEKFRWRFFSSLSADGSGSTKPLWASVITCYVS